MRQFAAFGLKVRPSGGKVPPLGGSPPTKILDPSLRPPPALDQLVNNCKSGIHTYLLAGSG